MFRKGFSLQIYADFPVIASHKYDRKYICICRLELGFRKTGNFVLFPYKFTFFFVRTFCLMS